MSRAAQEQQWAEDSIQEARHLHELTELTNEALAQGWEAEPVSIARDVEPDICDECQQPFADGVPCQCEERKGRD